jgi:hypothetical protein
MLSGKKTPKAVASPPRRDTAPHAIISLNVGGTHYTTALGTLTSQPGTLLSEMFAEGSHPPQDKDGCYFIDRDGESFRHVLNFLRDGTLPANAEEPMRKAMKMEAAFYQIPELLRWAQGSDIIGGQTESEADRVMDAFRGAAYRHLAAIFGRSAEQMIEQITVHLVKNGIAGSTTASVRGQLHATPHRLHRGEQSRVVAQPHWACALD